jgi:glutamate N-acetyltransferase/amino-acid N-acetyltransferase
VAEQELSVCSTGLIGSYLPMDKVVSGIRIAAGSLSTDDGDAARAIMTTDTVPKKAAAAHADGWSLGGIAKGAGMIAPDMATMLAFITTDAVVPSPQLSAALTQAVEISFNSITVDGDSSTNDTVLVFANGSSGIAPSPEDLAAALNGVCTSLARQIVADGEGATKVVSVQIRGAASAGEAKRAARTVADSLLVKTAVFGEDANWGRVAAAVGRAGVAVDFSRFGIDICGITLVESGEPGEVKLVDAARKAMAAREIAIGCDLAVGTASAEMLTTDLTPEYVKLNAEYEL